MVWEMSPLSIKPMSLVKVRDRAMRKNKPVLRTRKQGVRLVENPDSILCRSLSATSGFLN